MSVPQSPAGAAEINRGCNPRSTRALTLLSPAPRRGAGHPSRLASSPPPSPAPLRGAGERRNTLTSRGLYPRLSASRPCGACRLFLLRLCSGQAVREEGQAFQTASQLDFIHLEKALKAERQVCKLALTLVPKEVRHAHCPCRSDTADCKICPRIFQARLGTRPSIGGRGTARARQTHGDRRVAGHGAKPGAAVSEVSSRAEPGAVVESSTSARAVDPVGAHLCGQGAGRDWGGRYPGATAGGKDQSQGHLSRSGAVVARAGREGQWVTLALRDAAARDSVGGAGLGLAVSDRLVSLGAVSPAAGPTPQNVSGVGRATDWVDSPLAPGTGGCRGGR